MSNADSRSEDLLLGRLAELERSYDDAADAEDLPWVSPEERSAMATRVRTSLRARATEAEAQASGEDEEWDGDPQEVGGSATAVVELVRPPGHRRGRSVAVSVVFATVAAALLVWVIPRGGGETGSVRGGALALSSYQLSILNATVQEMRSVSEDGDVDRYELDSQIWWMIRPERPVTSPVGLRLVIEGEGGAVRVLEPTTVRVSADGIFELRGEVGSILQVEPGRWMVSFVVGAPDELPRDAAALSAEGRWVMVGDPYVVEIVPASDGPD